MRPLQLAEVTQIAAAIELGGVRGAVHTELPRPPARPRRELLEIPRPLPAVGGQVLLGPGELLPHGDLGVAGQAYGRPPGSRVPLPGHEPLGLQRADGPADGRLGPRALPAPFVLVSFVLRASRQGK